MRIETITTDTNGRVLIAAGYAIAFEPVERGLFPLDVIVNTDRGRVLSIGSNREVRPGPWTQLEMLGRRAGEVWRVYVAEAPGEGVGATDGSAGVLLWSKRFATGAVLVNNEGEVYEGEPFDLGTGLLVFDVRSARRVLLKVAHGSLTPDTGTAEVKVQLMLHDTNNLVEQNMGARVFEVTLDNEVPEGAHSANMAIIEIGAGVGEETSSTTVRRGLQWPKVSVQMTVGGDDTNTVTLANGMSLELWVFPS